MNNYSNTHLHPIESASALDSRFRLIFQNPRKILKKYVRSGMTVLDLGCGTGYFTLEIAELLDKNGKVIAADVQKGMLDILQQKLQNSELRKQVEIHNNNENKLNLSEKVDFILAFYSFHEMKFIDNIINDLTRIVKPETKILISEQKLHVSKSTFNNIIEKMENNGFEISEQPMIFFSRTVIMRAKQ
ncbi:MAG TPA: class I SAM-dependent methyltransferase [Salinivirgaceae bacterium]|nr:class I SAM-dependent methyltransferase [Salinivirgaceae bacterium]